MPKRSYKQIAIDPGLRETALRIIVCHEKRSTVPASDLPQDRMTALLPTAMKTVGEVLCAYDRGELPVTTQKQLIITLKKIVSKYKESK
jgi:hypothetical protein